MNEHDKKLGDTLKLQIDTLSRCRTQKQRDQQLARMAYTLLQLVPGQVATKVARRAFLTVLEESVYDTKPSLSINTDDNTIFINGIFRLDKLLARLSPVSFDAPIKIEDDQS